MVTTVLASGARSLAGEHPAEGARLVALLGKLEKPTDGVEDYCRWLGRAMRRSGSELECAYLPWPKGWIGALTWLWRESKNWKERWVCIQYTAFSWSRTGFSVGLVAALLILRHHGAKCAVVLHDPGPCSGNRWIDRLRRAVQVPVLQAAYRLADRSIFTVDLGKATWLSGDRKKAVFIPVGANLPGTSPVTESLAGRQRPKEVSVFCFTGGDRARQEAEDIAHAVTHAAKQAGPVRVVVLGRNAELGEGPLRAALANTGVELEIHGVLPAELVEQRLSQTDVLVFVRGGISTRRGSAIAGIACGLPVVSYAWRETGPPITDAGVVLGALGRPRCARRRVDSSAVRRCVPSPVAPAKFIGSRKAFFLGCHRCSVRGRARPERSRFAWNQTGGVRQRTKRPCLSASRGQLAHMIASTPHSKVPNLDAFAVVLDMLAERLKHGPAKTADWIGGSIVAAESKLKVLRLILKRAGASRNSTSLLDIGSQIGSLPVYAVQLGIRAAAVDNGNFANDCALAARDLGVDYRIADVGREPLPFADGGFDFVTYMDVIEHHAYSPKRVLLEASRVLSRGGLLIVTTPNHASIFNRFSLLFGKSVLDPLGYYFDSCADQEIYSGHHREYTQRELRTALEKTGYRVLECMSVGEGVRPQIRAMRRESAGGWLPAVKKYGKFVAAEALGPLWAVAPVPLGRTLWAVGQKR